MLYFCHVKNHFERRKLFLQMGLFLLLLAPWIGHQKAHGQQLPLFSVYRDHWNVINPAALSNNYLINEWNMSVGAGYRHQWLGIEGAPSTQLVNWEWVRDEFNSVFGAHLFNDRTGKIGQTGFYGQYAYRLNFGRRVDQSLLIGLSAGILQYRARLQDIEFFDTEEQPFENDKIIYPDFGLGIFYHYTDRYYAGLSIPQTFGLDTRFTTDEGDYPIRRVQHIYAVLGGYFQIAWFGNETSFVEPSIWIKYAPRSPLNADFNARFQISELVWAGLGFGTGFGRQQSGTLHIEGGVVLGEQIQLYNSQLKIGMGFDLPMFGGYGADFGSALEFNAVYSWQQ